MKKTSNPGNTKKLRGKFVQSIKDSLIISSLDKLCLKIYDLLCNGALSRLFAGDGSSQTQNSNNYTKKRGFLHRTSENISHKIEESKLARSFTRSAAGFFGLRMRVIGTFLMTFAAFCALIGIIKPLFLGTVASIFFGIGNGVYALIFAVASIPFLISKGTVSNALTESVICKNILRLLGFDPDKLWSAEVRGKHWAAFLYGAVAGIASLVVDPVFIFVAFIAIAIIYTVFATPEFGLMGIAFLMPFVPTMVLAGLTIFVAIAFLIKLIRGKRVLTFKRIDFFVAVFTVLLVLGGVVSHDIGSLAPAFLFVCLISVYFMVSCCVRSKEWLRKIILAIITSAMVVALYGIVQYAFGTFGANAWLDSDLFEGISGRAASTLENPNMLGEYLIMIIPMAFAGFLTGKDNAGASKKYTFLCLASMAMCLILTWSRGAWLGFMFSMVIFLLIWNKRSVWLFAGGVLMLPILPLVLPDSIIGRFTSIGNMADTSTSYRVHVWRGAMHMLRDNLFNGIGIGEAAWYELYPDYSLSGIEAAPHSHNLFLQIALEHSIFGLIIFLSILFLLVRICFSTFRRLNICSDYINEKRSTAVRLTLAGPLCGLAAVLLQGFTDYSWYNYRVYLMFWLVLGLIPALAKHDNRELDALSDTTHYPSLQSEASIDIKISENNSSEISE